MALAFDKRPETFDPDCTPWLVKAIVAGDLDRPERGFAWRTLDVHLFA